MFPLRLRTYGCQNLVVFLENHACNWFHWDISFLARVSHSVVSDFLWPMDCSPPSSSDHGILQTRILEWVVISFSRGFSWPRDRTTALLRYTKTLYPLSHQGSCLEDITSGLIKNGRQWMRKNLSCFQGDRLTPMANSNHLARDLPGAMQS